MANGWTGTQYSVFRALFGAYLCVHFLHLVPWAAELFSSSGVLPDGGLSPLFAAFPSIYAISDAPIFVQTTLLLAAAASIAFAIGAYDRIAALCAWLVLASLFIRNPLIANPSLPYVGFMLLAHLFVAPAPHASLASRGRADPDGGWTLSPSVFLAGWVVLAVSYSYSGYTKLLSPSWVGGDTIAYVLQNPLARSWALRDLFLWLPPELLTALTWIVLYVELLFAPIVLWKAARAWMWLAMLLIQFGFLFLLNFADLTIGMLLFHMFTFNPSWLPGKPFASGDVLYYDGKCAMCHGFVRFLLAEERTATLRFAPLQGRSFAAEVSEQDRRRLPDSLVFRSADGILLVRSEAVVRMLLHVGGLWTLLGHALRVIPLRLRDLGYDIIGAVRYRLFGARPDMCPLIPPGLRSRVSLD